jgi:hypothetical protein
VTNWWKKLFRRSNSNPSRPAKDLGGDIPPPNRGRAQEKASWLPADGPGNPFNVELLDLMVTQTIVATTTDRAIAARSVSWSGSLGEELDITHVADLPPIDCVIRLPVERSLPDGLLFTPSSMDEKWVIAWRQGRIIAARSWTGSVEVVADAKRDGDTLLIERVRVLESSPFRTLGTLPHTFEWLLRSHALGEKLPFPAHDEGAAILEEAPLTAFSAFGNVIFCAAKSWKPPPVRKPLRSDGRVVAAIREGDLKKLARAVDAGEDVDAPSTFEGYTALHLAVVRGETPAVERLIALGADVNRRCDRDMFALGLAIVHGAPPELFGALERAGADLQASNADGFGALHAAAEVGNAWAVRWLVERGHRLDGRTTRGHTPLQIGCGLGHLEAVKALVALGADVSEPSPDGVALDIALREGHANVVEWLRSRRAS